MGFWRKLLLRGRIFHYVSNYKGMGSATPFTDPKMINLLIDLGVEYNVDPRFILGIARSESSLATNTKLNGGKYNILGNSLHFNGRALYKNYEDALRDGFKLIRTGYLDKKLTTAAAVYKVYEGAESGWEKNLSWIVETMVAMGGDPGKLEFPDPDAVSSQAATP